MRCYRLCNLQRISSAESDRPSSTRLQCCLITRLYPKLNRIVGVRQGSSERIAELFVEMREHRLDKTAMVDRVHFLRDVLIVRLDDPEAQCAVAEFWPQPRLVPP